MGLLATRYTDDNERGKAMTTALGGLAFGVIIGPPIGGIMYQFLGGKTLPFLIICVLILIGVCRYNMIELFESILGVASIGTYYIPRYLLKILHVGSPLSEHNDYNYKYICDLPQHTFFHNTYWKHVEMTVEGYCILLS